MTTCNKLRFAKSFFSTANKFRETSLCTFKYINLDWNLNIDCTRFVHSYGEMDLKNLKAIFQETELY